jgi:hypothetical protein
LRWLHLFTRLLNSTAVEVLNLGGERVTIATWWAWRLPNLPFSITSKYHCLKNFRAVFRA